MGTKGNWFRRRPSDDEIREELEAHVAMRAEQDRVDEAAARRRLGNMLQTREAVRRIWIAQWWDALRQDAHFTWRSWRRRPAFALAAMLVLGLGLGASTALFAALDRVLFRPLPYADPDRLVSVGLLMSTSGLPAHLRNETMLDTSYVQVWHTTPAPFESVTAMNTATCDIAEERPERVRCGTVESNFLRLLGVRVILGRDFVPEDDVRGVPRVALISHGLWVRRFGADPRVIRRTLNLETAISPAQPVPIIGVLPPDFEMPVEAADILLPFHLRPLDANPRFGASFIQTFARLKPDVTPGRAEVMLAPQLGEVAKAMPPSSGPVWKVRLLRDRRVGDAARTAWLLMGAVVIFLLIACVNVTNLTLARVAERRREFAVRAAVGAGTRRLARLALAESLLLSLIAGGIGLLIAFALLKTFVAMAPADVLGVAEASIDLRVFAVAALLVFVTGTAIGMWPAISVFRTDAALEMRSTSSSLRGTRPHVRLGLVTTQVALTLALLGGSALLLRSLWNIVSLPLGFESERVVTLTADLGPTRYSTAAQRSAFFEDVLLKAQATPVAVSAALSTANPPLGSSRASLAIEVEGRLTAPGTRHPPIRIREITPGYFETFRMRLIRGRAFAEADRHGEPTVILTESAEQAVFRGERAEGRRVRLVTNGPWHTVIGVAPDLRNGQNLPDSPAPEIYVVAPRDAWRAKGYLALRTAAPTADAVAFLRQIVGDLDPALPVTIETVDEQVARLTAQPRFVASLLTAFALLALLLAAAGLYSVATYLVTQRRRDIGVCLALGAAPRDVARQVVTEAGRWITAGALLGCVLGGVSRQALQSQLHGVTALDPWSWTGALLALAVVLVLAVFRPAYRAAHVDPVSALRAD